MYLSPTGGVGHVEPELLAAGLGQGQKEDGTRLGGLIVPLYPLHLGCAEVRQEQGGVGQL